MRYAVSAALLVMTSTASAESLRFYLGAFDQDAIFLAENAKVIRGDASIYGWVAENSLVPSQVIYHFDVPATIKSAHFWSNSSFHVTTPNDFLLLSVSADGTNWTDVADGNASKPFVRGLVDVTAPLLNASEAYLRAQFFGEHMYVFRNWTLNDTAVVLIETVPEPHVAAMLLSAFGMLLRRKRS